MAKLDLKLPIVDEKGDQVASEETIGTTIGKLMMKSVSDTEGDILKFFGWAQNLGSGKPIDIDEADSKTIKKWITESKELYVIVKAPVLKAIDNLKFD